MSDKGKSTVAWVGVFLTALAMAGGMALFAARSAAAEEVRPVREDVAALKQSRTNADQRLERIENKVDRLLERTAR